MTSTTRFAAAALEAQDSMSTKSNLCLQITRYGTRRTPSLTPHIAADEGRHLGERRYEVVADNMRRFAAGEPLRNLVDKETWF